MVRSNLNQVKLS